jgi:putative oxidoreductase
VQKSFDMKVLEILNGKSDSFQGQADLNQLIVRLAIGIVMWPHGAQLLLGWFGGFGFTSSMSYFMELVHLPWLLGFGVIMIQFFGSLFILLGLFTKINAFLMSVMVFNMIFFGHLEHGFFMNWMGSQAGEGFEFHILLLGLSISLIFSSSNRFSLDFIRKPRTKKGLPVFDFNQDS